jgi:hypothetical protein
MERSIKEPLRYDQGDFCFRRVPRRVELGSVDDVLRTQMARDQVRSCVVMDNFGVFEGVLSLPYFCPLREHLCVVG